MKQIKWKIFKKYSVNPKESKNRRKGDKKEMRQTENI